MVNVHFRARSVDEASLCAGMDWAHLHFFFFFFNDTATTEIYTLSLHDALPISFRALNHEIIMRVVDKFLMQLDEQLAEKKVEAQFSQSLKEHLAKKGFDPLMGARPMARLIQDTIRRALADELLFGRLQHGGRVSIDVGDDEKIKLKFEEETAPVA